MIVSGVWPNSQQHIILDDEVDIDGDGYFDVVFVEDFYLVWYANDGSGVFANRQVISIVGSAKVKSI